MQENRFHSYRLDASPRYKLEAIILHLSLVPKDLRVAINYFLAVVLSTSLPLARDIEAETEELSFPELHRKPLAG